MVCLSRCARCWPLFPVLTTLSAWRTSCNTPANVNKTKAAIKKAFQNQLDGKGFSMVEIVTSCPTNWGLSPVEAMNWLEQNMIPYYPLGVYKDKEAK